jgi:cell division protein FtsL
MNRIFFALLAAILLCALIMIFADTTRDAVSEMEATQTQQKIIQTWDAELRQ